jgi:uncharacterized protein (TIGR02145 family)
MITIKSNPKDATIYIDDVEEGQTNKQLFKFPGNYKLNLRKNKYESIEQRITVSEQGSNEFSYNLGKTVAILTINTTPSDAEIYVNGSKKTEQKIEVAPGRYRIEVKKSGYSTVSRTIMIEQAQDQTQSFTLQQLTGKLQFVVEPMETKVILKQGSQQIDTWTGSKYLSDIGVGNYTLELSASSYSNQTKTITISENKTTNIDIKMVKKKVPIVINNSSAETQHDFGICRDIDGNVYKTIKIGNQIWMAENLKVTHYRNGDEIPKITDNTAWSKTTKGAKCAYENDNNNIEKYGYLYSWNAVGDSRNIAPEGWHVPTEEEWNQLEIYLGTKAEDVPSLNWRGSESGKKLKAKAGWDKNGNGTDVYGFSVLPGGYRHYDGNYDGLGNEAVFWTSEESNMMSAWFRAIISNNSAIKRDGIFKEFAFSIRCIKDISDNSTSTLNKPKIDMINENSGTTCKDIDGRVYKTVKIGDQVWMAENLRVSHYRNGDEIPNIKDNDEWKNTKSGAMCTYENSVYNKISYGYLYNWFAVNDYRNIAPEGWHVATDDDWKQLEKFLGMSQSNVDETGWRGTDQGNQLKAKTGWENKENNTDLYGFAVQPGGFRNYNGNFSSMGDDAEFWVVSSDASVAWNRILNNNKNSIYRSKWIKESGFSIRCVKD